MGRDPFEAEVELGNGNGNGPKVKEMVQFFSWEKLDSVEIVKKAFNL
jgi:hypothetical protein